MNDRPRTPPSARWLPWLKALISLSLILILIANIDLMAFREALRSADLQQALLGYAVFAGLALAETLRLFVVLSSYPVPFWGAIRLYFTGMFFSNFIPSSLGAEVYKVHLLHRLGGDLARPIALLLLLRVVGMGLMLLCALAYLPFAYPRLEQRIDEVLAAAEFQNGTVLMILIGGAVLGLILLGLPQSRRFLTTRRPTLRFAIRSLTQLGVSSHLVLIALGLVVVACRAGSIYYFARALAVEPRFLDMLLVVTAVNLAALIPVSLGALGVREGSMAIGLAAFGVAPAPAVAIALLSRSALWSVSLVGGCLLLRGHQASPEKNE